MDEREQRRLDALAGYGVMDTPREASFDELAALTARLCDAPIAVVNLIGDGRQFFKAEVGLGVRETPLDSSFCAQALLEEEMLVVPDLAGDPRFAGNPLVTGAPHIRAYAGALLKTADGLPIGTLCVLDHRTRPFTDLHQETLRVLARQVMAQLDLRRTVQDRDRRYDALRISEERLRLVMDSARDYAIVTTDPDRRITSWSAGARATFGWSEAEATGQPVDALIVPEDRAAAADDPRWHRRADGTLVFLNGSTHPILDGDDAVTGFLTIARDETGERTQADALARTRAALADSEARFRNMADHAPVMLWVTDPDGACTYLNRRWYAFTGQTPAEAEGYGWLDATHPDDRAMTERVFLAANAERAPFRLEYRLRHADGRYHTAIDAAAPRFGPAGEFLGYIGSVIDIQDRREAEQKLADSELRYRTLFESIESGFCVVEVAIDPAAPIDYRVLEANPAFYRQTGLDETILNRWMRDALPDLEEHWYDIYGRVARTGDPVRFEQGAATLGRWFDIAAFRIGPPDARRVAVLFNDISARRRAEEALVDVNATLEDRIAERTAERDRMWDSAPDLMAVLDSDRVLRRVNPAWTTLLGYAPGDLVGRPVTAFVLPDDDAATLAAPAAGGQRAPLEQRYRHRDGSVRRIAWVSARGDDLIYATGRDVTAERERDAELARAQEQLRQAQKMEAVGQLTGGLAHDFNNLLTGMMGNLELLQLRVARGRLDDLDRFVLAAQGAGRRAAALTQRLLAFSRRQTLDPKPTDVNRLIAGMEDLLRRTVGPATVIEVVGAGGLWPANIDAGQLENALLNLCINARDAMPDGGRLTIETANKWLDDRSGRERDLPPGQYLSLCVTDTGTGMSADTIARAFEPFFTTKPLGEGTGLGLSMIYGFARQSNGQVRIYSELGQGTTICVYLPRHVGDALLPEQEDAIASAAAASGETVLVVDDEATIRHLIDEVLDEVGYTVIGAADGAAGLKVLQSGARIELLITDVGLPGGMNGRQVADAARLLRPGLKVLFITGYAENAAVGNGHLEPGMELLTKPFTMEALTAKVAAMMQAD